MAITSIDIDQDLLRQVKKITGVRTNKDAVEAALSTMVRIANQQEAVKRIAKQNFIMDGIAADTIDYDV